MSAGIPTPAPVGAPTRPGRGTPGAPAAPPKGDAPSALTPADLGPDQGAWQPWWALHRDEFLDLAWEQRRTSGATGRESDQLRGRPSVAASEVDEQLLPLLAKLVRDPKQARYLRASALLAAGRLARVEGDDLREARVSRLERLEELMSESLTDDSFTVHEAAVLGLGLVGTHDAIVELGEIVNDSAAGRKAIGDSRVSIRSRSLAAYALGLAAYHAPRVEMRTYALHQLLAVLESKDARHADLVTAVLVALGTTPATGPALDEAGEGPPPSDNLDALGTRLLDWLEAPHTERVLRERVPTALARLTLNLSEELQTDVVRALAKAVDQRSRLSTPTRRAAALALGWIGSAGESGQDTAIRSCLQKGLSSKDAMLRRYSALSLARVGSRAAAGEEPFVASASVAKILQKHLSKGRSADGPWSALALGMFAYHSDAAGQSMHGSDQVLAHAASRSKSPDRAPAYALAAGLAGAEGARKFVEKRYQKIGDSQVRGQLALGLALAGDRSILPFLRDASGETHHRPDLKSELALARAVLADDGLVLELIADLTDCDCWASTRGNARALARVGDATAFGALLDIAGDDKRTDHARMEVVRALGWLASGATGPWSEPLLPALDVVGAPETLTGPTGFGVLDRQ